MAVGAPVSHHADVPADQWGYLAIIHGNHRGKWFGVWFDLLDVSGNGSLKQWGYASRTGYLISRQFPIP